MLKNISPIISPDLLKVLCEMGHGDEIVFSDAHFPAKTVNANVIRADGNQVTDLVKAVLPLFVLDQFVQDNVVMMAAVEGDTHPEGLQDAYQACLPPNTPITYIERFAFYERAKLASCVVVTSTTLKYGNIILKKGVTQS